MAALAVTPASSATSATGGRKSGSKHHGGHSHTVWRMWLFLLRFDGLIKALRVASGLLEKLLEVRLAIYNPL